MSYSNKARAIICLEAILLGIGAISVFGFGIYRDSVDQMILDSVSLEERVEMFDKLGTTKLKFGLFVAMFFLVWLLLTILLYQGHQMKSYCHLKSWVLLQTIIYTFVLLGLFKDYSTEFYMNYKTVQLIVFLLYRLWSCYIIWNYHHQVIKQKQKMIIDEEDILAAGDDNDDQHRNKRFSAFQIIEYSRSPVGNTSATITTTSAAAAAIANVDSTTTNLQQQQQSSKSQSQLNLDLKNA